MCSGDCDYNGAVTVDEIIHAVNIALGTSTLSVCPAIDFNSDGVLTVDELIRAINKALSGCG